MVCDWIKLIQVGLLPSERIDHVPSESDCTTSQDTKLDWKRELSGYWRTWVECFESEVLTLEVFSWSQPRQQYGNGGFPHTCGAVIPWTESEVAIVYLE